MTTSTISVPLGEVFPQPPDRPLAADRAVPGTGLGSRARVSLGIGTERVHAWRRRLSLLAAVLVMSVVGLSVTSTLTAPAAHAYAPTSNGCGAASGLSHYLVPNAPFGFDFLNACNNHDQCYGAGNAKSFCDAQFGDDMDAVCDGNLLCEAISWLYQKAVQWFGRSSWTQATQERLDDLMDQLTSCGDDADCATRVTDQANLDSFLQGISACQGNTACEDSVRAQYQNSSGVSDDPSTDPSQTDPTVGDPGDPDAGDPGDPGDGGSGDIGTGGGGGGGGGDTCEDDSCHQDED